MDYYQGTDREGQDAQRLAPLSQDLARRVLAAFILTFLSARILVSAMMLEWLPDVFLSVRGTHVHHLSYGIVLLAGVGAYLLFGRPENRRFASAATLYGVGLGLTFDEFGMWLRLDDTYWQRVSFDAVVLIAGCLALVAVLPTMRRFRPRHWAAGLAMVAGLVLLVGMMMHSYRYAHGVILPKMQVVEMMRAVNGLTR